MKNTQLKTGNKVYHNGVVKTIDSICRSAVTFVEDCTSEDKYGEWVDLDEVEFIKLDSEWLRKLNIIPNDYFREGFGIYWFTGHNPEVPIQYVNQLQNLFFILKEGQELTISE